MDNNFKAFPQMIYHLAEGQKIVNTKEELDVYLNRGWLTSPAKLQEKDRLEDMIAHYRAELKRMENELKNLISQAEVPENDSELAEETKGEKLPTMQQLRRKKGRPRKGA
jgi:Skp family chaperone for outer membrane proteins